MQGLSVGEKVSGEGHLVCGHCRSCRAGHRHLCINTKGIGVSVPGCFAEYLALPAKNVFPIPRGVSDDEASILDPFGNAVHTALSFDLVGEDVLITGAGPIGIMAAAVCRHVGARHVVLTDVNEYRLKLARKVGVEHAVDTGKTKLAQVMKDLGMTEGFDVGLEMSGSPAAFNSMIRAVKMGANIALLGILPDDAAIPWSQVIFKALTLKGIYGREMFETWYKMCAMLQSGLDIKPVVTHRFPFTEFEKGLCGHALGQVRESHPGLEPGLTPWTSTRSHMPRLRQRAGPRGRFVRICLRGRTRREIFRSFKAVQDRKDRAARAERLRLTRPRNLIPLVLVAAALGYGLKGMTDEPVLRLMARLGFPVLSAPPAVTRKPLLRRVAAAAVPGAAPVSSAAASSSAPAGLGQPSAATAPAPLPSFWKITGKVYDIGDLRPVVGARITFTDVVTGKKSSFKTDRKGEYAAKLPAVEKGYAVSQSHPRYGANFLEEEERPYYERGADRRKDAEGAAARFERPARAVDRPGRGVVAGVRHHRAPAVSAHSLNSG